MIPLRRLADSSRALLKISKQAPVKRTVLFDINKMSLVARIRRLIAMQFDKLEADYLRKDKLDPTRWRLVYNTGRKRIKIELIKFGVPLFLAADAHLIYTNRDRFGFGRHRSYFDELAAESDLASDNVESYDYHLFGESVLDTELLPVLCLTFSMALIAALVSRRYVKRIYYNQRTGTFKFVTDPIWFIKNQFDCAAGRATEMPLNPFIDHFRGGVKLSGGRRVIVSQDYFSKPIYYNVLFGFESPAALNQIQRY